ncbi:hypothetical protein LSH36_899g00029 [Paralvinella palmiformis]|uniref:Uncharacterized protein n=1 Tax=Paralvinella palmiformis TaxID=53620 RepID=A0AAD9IYK4_9ANNE|nr:hypothetical protein LSH36_899g00029 [Paralvinella palmiformis]
MVIFAGYTTILLLAPLQAYLAKLSSGASLKRSKAADTRVQLMSEIISGINVIKMYFWEKPFGQRLNTLRKTELKCLRQLMMYSAVLSELCTFNFRIISAIVVVVTVYVGEPLDASKTFPMFALFNVLVESVLNFTSWGLKSFFDLQVSIKRIETSRTLRNVTLSIPEGQLVAVIGDVGSGKSSLLELLLGEIGLTTGGVAIRGRLAYTPQQPWLFPDTIKENIVFGGEFNRRLFEKVINMTALDRDISIFPHGYLSRVGDRGLKLSGGQKTRITLARMLYQDADVYLFDDPLSAVDAAVGRHIFDRYETGEVTFIWDY